MFAFSHRYCNEHLLCPPHVFWTGWGPWERCTAQCGGGIQARRRTCENGPDCPGCSVVSKSQLVLQQMCVCPYTVALTWVTRMSLSPDVSVTRICPCVAQMFWNLSEKYISFSFYTISSRIWASWGKIGTDKGCVLGRYIAFFIFIARVYRNSCYEPKILVSHVLCSTEGISLKSKEVIR